MQLCGQLVGVNDEALNLGLEKPDHGTACDEAGDVT
jgi:hypothetical protein